ncbi:MAG: hypothetical protein QW739_00700 [Candidatus Odinarchaeota archaeon]
MPDIKVNLDNIATRIKEILNNTIDGNSFLPTLWKIRSEVEYLTGILSLDLEGNVEFEKITRPLRLKKEEKNKNNIINQINKVVLELSNNKSGDNLHVFEKLWKLREFTTILLRLMEPPIKKDKAN